MIMSYRDCTNTSKYRLDLEYLLNEMEEIMDA